MRGCHGEGYKGRLGLYEVVVVDDAMQKLIHDGCSEAELVQAARAAGPSCSTMG
jgi:general secretion pathway protein E